MGRPALKLTSVWTAGILLFIGGWSGFPDSAEKERRITIKAAAHPDFRVSRKWRTKLSLMVRDANTGFRRRWGISFHVEEFEYWDPEPGAENPDALIRSLRETVARDGCHILLGYLPEDFPGMASNGAAGYIESAVLLKDHPSREGLAKILRHEFCHIFGAIDLDEKGSIMNYRRPGHVFDAFTSEVIALNRDRGFVPGEFPLSGETRDRAIDLYITRMNEMKFEPEIPVVLSFLIFENIKYDPLSAPPGPGMAPLHEWSRVYYLLGNQFFKRGRIDRAEGCYRAAVQARPEYVEPRAGLVRLCLSRGRTAEAVRHARRAREAAPHCPRCLNILGVALAASHEYTEAEAVFREAIRKFPDFNKSGFNLGVLYIRTGRSARAIPWFQRDLANGRDTRESRKILDMLNGRGKESSLPFGPDSPSGWPKFKLFPP